MADKRTTTTTAATTTTTTTTTTTAPQAGPAAGPPGTANPIPTQQAQAAPNQPAQPATTDAGGRTGTNVQPSTSAMHANLPPVVTQNVVQQRRVEETTQATLTATLTPEELALVQRQRNLRAKGIIEIRPGHFQRINFRPPVAPPNPPPTCPRCPPTHRRNCPRMRRDSCPRQSGRDSRECRTWTLDVSICLVRTSSNKATSKLHSQTLPRLPGTQLLRLQLNNNSLLLPSLRLRQPPLSLPWPTLEQRLNSKIRPPKPT